LPEKTGPIVRMLDIAGNFARFIGCDRHVAAASGTWET
jgi:hypothetical protein